MKYEILKDFTDKHTNIDYKVGDIIEFSAERVEEIKSKETKLNIKLIKKVKTKRVVE